MPQRRKSGSAAERELRARIAELEAALARATREPPDGELAAVRNVADRHRDGLDALPDAVFVYVDEKVVYVNQAAVEILGARSKDDLIGKPALTHVLPEYREQQRERRRKVLEERCTLPAIVQRRRRLDGQEIWVETKATFTWWDGKPAFLGTVRDITGRKLAEQALEEIRLRLQAITENVPGAVYERVLHPDGRVEFPYISSGVKEITGLEPEAIRANPALLLERIDPAFRDEHKARTVASAAALTPFEMEFPLRGPSGERRWVRCQGRPRRRADGAVAWDGLLIDITGQQQVEQRAKHFHDCLLGAVESMPDGFILWDPHDRLVLCNRRIFSTYPGDPALLTPGTPYETLMRGPYEVLCRTQGEAAARSWLEQRNRLHREATGSFQFEGLDGRCFVLTERRTPTGSR